MKKILILLMTIIMFSCSDKGSGSIVGEATTSDGVLANITVKLYDENANLLETTVTDEEGNFAFTNLSEGNYYIAGTTTIDNEVWDSGTTPNLFYVGSDTEKITALTLSKK